MLCLAVIAWEAIVGWLVFLIAGCEVVREIVILNEVVVLVLVFGSGVEPRASSQARDLVVCAYGRRAGRRIGRRARGSRRDGWVVMAGDNK